ncbi:MAG: hypothetical protein LW731_04670 [Oxalobacteraceae bacterium]|jgi:hypothetical protein|nr:hypothetical protein [Oxalobacteraceae bacterium]
MTSNDMGGLPGAGAMNDTLEFVRNMWGAMKIPGMSMPSMSPDDINKQITDLKAVESWLLMNMNMLRTTIQTLEVQSATLAAIQAMGQSFSQAGASRPTAEGTPAFESPFEKAAGKTDTSAPGMPDTAAFAAQFANPALWWNTVQDQFAQAVNQVVTPPKKPATKKAAPKKKAAGAAKKTAASRGTKKAKT